MSCVCLLVAEQLRISRRTHFQFRGRQWRSGLDCCFAQLAASLPRLLPPLSGRPERGIECGCGTLAGPKRIKEVFERMHVAAPERQSWPVVEWQGEIVWMQGVELESDMAEDVGLKILTEPATANPV